MNGGAITAADNTGGSILVCNGTLASLSAIMPANPRNKQTFHIASECAVTSLILSSGTSITGAVPTILGAPSGITATTPVTFVYDNDRLIWTRW